MLDSIVFEGHAIVSEDGMIADAQGAMPNALRDDEDWRRFQASLDRAAVVVLGRLGHERHPNPGRRRLVLTRSVPALSDDPNDNLAVFWNPAGMDIAEVLVSMGVATGTVAITGGTGAFDLFLPMYTRFILSEVRGLMLPGGTPCFTKDHPRLVLPGAGLAARDMEVISRQFVQTHWVRAPRVGVAPV